jgi:hypothetical protein
MMPTARKAKTAKPNPGATKPRQFRLTDADLTTAADLA